MLSRGSFSLKLSQEPVMKTFLPPPFHSKIDLVFLSFSFAQLSARAKRVLTDGAFIRRENLVPRLRMELCPVEEGTSTLTPREPSNVEESSESVSAIAWEIRLADAVRWIGLYPSRRIV